MLSLNKSYKNRKVSLTIHCKYKYFDSTVQRAEERRQKFAVCRLPFTVNVKLNLSNSVLAGVPYRDLPALCALVFPPSLPFGRLPRRVPLLMPRLLSTIQSLATKQQSFQYGVRISMSWSVVRSGNVIKKASQVKERVN